MNYILTLYSSKKTVFSLYDIESTIKFPSKDAMNKFLQRAKQDKRLINPYRGIWALPHYDPLELASKIRPTSYISCETVLFKAGIFFQFYGTTISCVSDDSRTYTIDQQEIIYYKIKTAISHNPIGIKTYATYRIATPERALCDYIYLHPRGTIDAPENINYIRLKQILPFYPKKTALYIQNLLHVS